MRHRAGLLLFPERLSRLPAPGVGEPSASAPPDHAVPTAGGQPRYLLLHLPAFSLERCGFLAQDPAVCVAPQRGAARVVALTPAARVEGIGLGMSAAQARALHPDLAVIEHDPAAERADHAELLRCFAHLGERLAAWGPGGVLLEIHAVAHLFGGESALLSRVLDRAEQLGHCACGVIADDPLVAQALAESRGESLVIPAGGGASALAPLPLRALHPSASLGGAARALGVERIGEWAALEPAAVAARFGKEGLRLLRLARGEPVTPLPWSEPDPGPVTQGVVLGGPTVSLGPIWFVLPGLLQKLCADLLARDAMAVRLAVRLLLERGPPQVVRIRVGEPGRDPDRLASLIRARLERVRLAAPAVELHVEVEEHTAERLWQLGLLDRNTAAEPLADLLARLSDALGDGAVFSAELVERWRPEQAWSSRPFVPGGALSPGPVHRKADRDPVTIQRAFESRGLRPRPTLLFADPERVQVETDPRTGAPRRLRYHGRWFTLDRCEGPERIETDWWSLDGGVSRDYWVVGVQGRPAWCFSDDRASWFLHGWFD